jgi:hypothetical protein
MVYVQTIAAKGFASVRFHDAAASYRLDGVSMAKWIEAKAYNASKFETETAHAVVSKNSANLWFVSVSTTAPDEETAKALAENLMNHLNQITRGQRP